MFYYWWDRTWIILVPAIVLSLIAQARVSAAYNRYSRVATQGGRTAADVVAEMFAREGIENVRIESTRGRMTDHYDPRALALRLSEGVATIPLLWLRWASPRTKPGTRCNTAMDMPPMLRSASVFAVNIGSNLSWPLVILGLIFSFEPLIMAGIALFSLVVLFGHYAARGIQRQPPRPSSAGKRRLSRRRRTRWRAQGVIRRCAHLCSQRVDRHFAARAPAGHLRRWPQSRLKSAHAYLLRTTATNGLQSPFRRSFAGQSH